MCNASNADLPPVWSGLTLSGDGLACQRGARSLFRNLSFTLHCNEALVVTGPMARENPHSCVLSRAC